MVTKAQKPHLDTDIYLRHRIILHSPHLSCNEAAVTLQPTTSNFPLMEVAAMHTLINEDKIFTHKLTAIKELEYYQLNTMPLSSLSTGLFHKKV